MRLRESSANWIRFQVRLPLSLCTVVGGLCSLDLCLCVVLADKTDADFDRYTKLLEEKLLTLDLREGLVDKAEEEKRRWGT